MSLVRTILRKKSGPSKCVSMVAIYAFTRLNNKIICLPSNPKNHCCISSSVFLPFLPDMVTYFCQSYYNLTKIYALSQPTESLPWNLVRKKDSGKDKRKKCCATVSIILIEVYVKKFWSLRIYTQ